MKRCVRFLLVFACTLAWMTVSPVAGAQWGNLSRMHDYETCFGIDKDAKPRFKVTMLSSNAAGNVYHEGERPALEFQVENLSDEPLKVRGRVEVLRYAQRRVPGDMWWPRLERLDTCGDCPVAVDLAPKAWANLTVRPPVPETKGGYGLVVDLGSAGRAYLTSLVRTFKPHLERIAFPKQSLEHMPPEILARLGVQTIRYGVSFIAPDEGRRYEQLMERLEREFHEMHEHRVTCTVEIGAGSRHQPLGRGRPHLDDNGVMKGGKQDLCWLPAYDDVYQQFVYDLAREYGFPKGPINGFMLWNEPWEGHSISGWQADMLRYRELYRRMGEAVHRARKDAGVEVLVGGCDSSTNTWDKLFPDGKDTFLKYLDFCSIHYQGLAAPVLYPEWNERKAPTGRVRIWDTESWVANSDEVFAGVVAANRAAGYDRSMGTLSRIAVSTLSHHRVAHDTIRTGEGKTKIERHLESRPLAASYGAVQHFIGQREFREILFKNGLPWVFVFDGLDGNPDDGTAVVVGDLGALFGKKGRNLLFHTVRSLQEVRAKRERRRTLAAGKGSAEERADLRADLAEPMPLEGVTLTLEPPPGCRLFDFYGNPVKAEDGRYVIPLNERAFFLRGDPERQGSMDALLEALRAARIDGLEPVEIVPYDMLKPVGQKPTLRLRVTNMLNRPVEGTLAATLGDLAVEYPKTLSLEPRERKRVDVRVTGGKARADNTYPLSAVFDAGDDGTAEHHEAMHVNWIHRRTVTVDGRLDDWKGAIPQTVNATGPGGPSFEEAMWLPFETFKAGTENGVAVAYLACDDTHFYFAARIADDSPHPGAIRFADRDHDAAYYPEVCTEIVQPRGKKKAAGAKPERRTHRWPEGVRRFSYRRWPALPSSYHGVPYDNVLLAFNAIGLGEDGWLSHLPGRMPKFVAYKTTDYEYALNRVSEPYGGGTEIWRLQCPGMPRKHFYPRQPRHPKEGAVDGGQLVVRYEEGTRLVECALPWSEIPDVKARLDAGETVKFSYRVNHNTRGPDMELARGRSACEGLSRSFHPDWARSWPNELEFAFEPK